MKRELFCSIVSLLSELERRSAGTEAKRKYGWQKARSENSRENRSWRLWVRIKLLIVYCMTIWHDLSISSKVYKCTYWGKQHVVKKVPISKGTQTFRTVMSEFMVLSQVKHPRIVNLVTFYQTSVDWNFVLEYMSNGSLRDLLIQYKKNSWRLSESDLLGMFVVSFDFMNDRKPF